MDRSVSSGATPPPVTVYARAPPSSLSENDARKVNGSCFSAGSALSTVLLMFRTAASATLVTTASLITSAWMTPSAPAISGSNRSADSVTVYPVPMGTPSITTDCPSFRKTVSVSSSPSVSVSARSPSRHVRKLRGRSSPDSLTWMGNVSSVATPSTFLLMRSQSATATSRTSLDASAFSSRPSQ